MNTNEYGAISIDTSIFERNSLNLESGLLKKLDQFKPTEIDVILSDIVLNEVSAHLHKKINDTKSALDKALRNVEADFCIDGSIIKASLEMLEKGTVESITTQRIQNFKDNTGLEVIAAEEYLDVKLLVSSYFNNNPPFSATGKKKSEFPDAIALLSLEAWAKDNGKKMIVVSADNDWIDYSKNSDWLDCTEDLAEALSVFQPQTAPYAFFSSLAAFLATGTDNDFYSQIEENASNYTSQLDPSIEADSYYQWEQEDNVECSLESMKFITDKNNVPVLRLIKVDVDYVVIQAIVNIEATASSSFSFSVYDSIDKDDVSLGGISAETTFEYKTEVLITFSGDFTDTENFSDIEISEIEFLSSPSSIDFGELALDYGADEDYEENLP